MSHHYPATTTNLKKVYVGVCQEQRESIVYLFFNGGAYRMKFSTDKVPKTYASNNNNLFLTFWALACLYRKSLIAWAGLASTSQMLALYTCIMKTFNLLMTTEPSFK